MGQRPPVLIVGGGIGGIAAALALARTGREILVLESRAAFEETGAGLQLGPNAVRMLERLGVLERVAAHAFEPVSICIHDMATSRPLARLPVREEMRRRFGMPYWTLRRQDLLDALVGRMADVPEITARFGLQIERLSLGEDPAAARRVVAHPAAADDPAIEGVAAIGADGLWSRCRAFVPAAGDTRPRPGPAFSGHTAWRAMIPMEDAPAAFTEPDVSLFLGPDTHLVAYPVARGRLLNIVAVVEDPWQGEGYDHNADPAPLLVAFARAAPAIRDLLGAVALWRRWALYGVPADRPWTRGPVTLVGDAAHPVLPFLAQGAALALEDAVALGCALQGAPDDIAGAFRRYEAARRPRAARVQAASQSNGGLYHMRGPMALARNAVMGLVPARRLLSRYDWLYGYRG
ncbi:MAG: FAD-dependent monooxygenase [Hyphomicrobiaceae bacterium]